MIDADGFRANIGIILHNDDGRLFWARRVGNTGWQFPQGGMQDSESPQEAMYRELQEETGLLPDHVELVCESRRWLRYSLPDRYVRRHSQPLCLGQKQRWFLLRLTGDEGCVDLNCSGHPEFDDWCWVNYWRPPEDVVFEIEVESDASLVGRGVEESVSFEVTWRVEDTEEHDEIEIK